MRAAARGFLACVIMGGAAWAVLDLRVWHGPLRAWLLQGQEAPVVAEVAGTAITRAELETALREHLWLRGETWSSLAPHARDQARKVVLQQLVDARLVRIFRQRENTAADRDSDARVRHEAETLRRQFVTSSDYLSRLAGQGHVPKSFEEIIRQAQLDEAWLLGRAMRSVPAVTRRDAQAWHDRSNEALRIPPAHHCAHLFLRHNGAAAATREPEIRRIFQQLARGEKSFAALVQLHSEDSRSKALGGDLGWLTRQRMPADFMAAVEQVEAGQVGGPVATALGWHLLRVVERRPSRVPKFEEVEGEITALLTTRQRAEAVAAVLAWLRQHPQAHVLLHAGVIAGTVPAR